MANVKQLEELQALLKEQKKLDAAVCGGNEREYRAKRDNTVRKLGALPGIPKILKTKPVLALESELDNNSRNAQNNFKLYTWIALAVFAFGWIVGLNGLIELGAVCIVFGGGTTLYMRSAAKDRSKDIQKQQEEQAKKDEEAAKAASEFRTALKSYETNMQTNLNAAIEYKKQYLSAIERLAQLEEEHRTVQQEGIIRLHTVEDEIQKHTYISEEYYHLLPNIIALMKSYDLDFEGALHTALAKETQDQEERERERERQRAAERERQRNAEAQAEALRKLGKEKCRQCRNYWQCSYSSTESGAGLNCSRFWPK